MPVAVDKGNEPAVRRLLSEYETKSPMWMHDVAETGAAPTERLRSIPSYRGMSQEDATRLARTEQHIIPSNAREEFIGGPDGVKNREDLLRMRAEYDRRVEAGMEGSDWYERTQGGVRETAGPDPARQHLQAQELGLTSNQATPETNLQFGLAGHNAYEAGTPPTGMPMKSQAKTYNEGRAAGEIDLGDKTGPYSSHFDPTMESPATPTNDIWQARGFGYSERQIASGLKPHQHAFLDAETLLAADRANAKKLGGRDNWTPGEIQAASWVESKATGLMKKWGWSRERALADAKSSYPDYFPKHTASGTHEATPGYGIGHLPDVVGGTFEERAAFAARPESTWEGPGGRDILYDAAGMYVRPTNKSTGLYQSPGGPMEINPAAAARPLVSLEPGGKSVSAIDRPSKAMLNKVEAARAYTDAQNAGAWSKPFLNAKPSESTSLYIPHDRPLTTEQMTGLKRAGEKYGLGDVVDYGDGIALTNFMDGPPPVGVFNKALKEGILQSELKAIVPGTPQRAKMETGYISYEEAWKAGEGSGKVTAELKKWLEGPDAPATLAKLDASKEVRKAAFDRMTRDAEIARKTGQPIRADLQRARSIIATSGFTGLFEAWKKGVALPAAALAPFLLALRGEHQGE